MSSDVIFSFFIFHFETMVLLNHTQTGNNFHDRFVKNEPSPTSEELANAWSPHISYVLKNFGPSRCMFESNFPLDKVSCSYNNLWNAFKRIVKSNDLNQTETDMVFWKTAAYVYKMELPGLYSAREEAARRPSSLGAAK